MPTHDFKPKPASTGDRLWLGMFNQKRLDVLSKFLKLLFAYTIRTQQSERDLILKSIAKQHQLRIWAIHLIMVNFYTAIW
jgi:hypothetical protein